MAWTDLPNGWNLLPLTHPALLNDVLDLAVGAKARHDGGLSLMLCDKGERLLTPVEISPLTDAPESASDRAATLRPLLESVTEGIDDVTLLAAIGRPGGLSVTEDDVSWAEALARACDGVVRLLGVHLVTADGNRPIPWSPRAA
jgi:hypothetical protein